MSDIVLDQEKLDNILSGLPFTLNEKQMKFIVGFINGTGHWCLLSPAGGGKSLMMLVLSKYYGDEMIFTSSTGISSENMPEGISSGTTHGVMSLPTKPATDYDYRKVSSKCSKILASSSIVKLIAFDEAFYLNSDSLDVLLRRKTRFDKKTAKRDRRDIRFLFVGDTCQGTTITDKPLKVELSKRHGHHLMFMTDLWENMDITYAMLDKVERQDDRNFKAALDVIRYYEKDRLPKCLEWINKRYGLTPPENSILLAATNKTVSKTNDWYLKNNPNPKQVYQSTQSGIVNKKEIPVGDSFTACVGLRVLTINNQRDGLWQNEIGRAHV